MSKQLSILTGAGINMAIANECLPAQQQHLMDLTYQKVSQNIYNQLPANYQALFQPNSFDYILGGLMTISLAMEKTKQDAQRFNIDPAAFGDLFQTSGLQQATINALNRRFQLRSATPELQVSCTDDRPIHALAARRSPDAGVAAPTRLQSARDGAAARAQPQHYWPRTQA